MLSIFQIKVLAKFFDSLDGHLIAHMGHGAPPKEEELTRRLWAMLQGEDSAWRLTAALDMTPVDWLKGQLARDGYELSFDLKMGLQGGLEADVSSSDFGLIVEYRDLVGSAATRIAPYLVQAKKLYRDPNRGGVNYHANDKFGAADEEQRMRLGDLGRVLGENAVKYLAYCPRLPSFDPQSQTALRGLQAANSGMIYTGTTFGMMLSVMNEGARDTSMAGNWVAQVRPGLHTAASLHREAFTRCLPLGWFIIANLCVLSREDPAGHMPFWTWNRDDAFGLNVLDTPELELARGLALGETQAATTVAQRLGTRVPRVRLSPPATLTVRMTRALQMELDLGYDDHGPPPPRLGG